MSSPDLTFEQALAAFNHRNLVDAERLFKKAIKAQPGHLGALNLLTVVLMSTGRFGEAEAYIAQAVALNQTSDVSFYNYGIVLKQLNKPKLAREQFDAALRLNPNVPETWNNRGAVCNELQDYERAISDFDRALSLNGNYAEAFYNKGISLGKLHRHDEALATYDEALARKPDFAEAWVGRGNALAELKQDEQACAAFERALELKPDLVAGWHGRGNALAELERYDEALAAFDKALALAPDLAGAWLGRGHALAERKRYDEALAAYGTALELKPGLAKAWHGRGKALSGLKRYDEALAAYDKALAIEPGLEGAWLGCGNVFSETKRYDEAFAAYDKTLEIKPGFAGAWLGRGKAFTELKRYDEALAAYDEALALKPNSADAWHGRGNVFTELKRYDEAIAAFDRAIALRPDMADAYLNKSLLLLSRGEFNDGWELYEWRPLDKSNAGFGPDAPRLSVSVRQDRNALAGKNVAILSEQGIGDEIMFASMLPDLIKDAKSIHYEVDPRLTGLMQIGFPGVHVTTKASRDYLNKRDADQDIDVVLQAGSLGYAYRRSRELFPRTPYLSADPGRAKKWNEILAREAGGRKRIGISWRGGAVTTRRGDRSIDLDRLFPLIQNDHYFVSLQYGDVRDEISRFNNGGTSNAVHCPLDDFNNFDDFSALIAGLDLVVSVQNVTIHMSGSLGKTCWGMIPWRAEWRYGMDDKSMAWYRSVVLHRQSKPDDWDDVIDAVNSNFAGWVRAQSHD